MENAVIPRLEWNRKPGLWSGLLLRLVLVALVCASFLPLSRGRAAETVGSPIILEEPTVTPADGPPCTSGWLKMTNNRGHTAFLTLNVKDAALAHNSSEWRPSFAQDGFYLVEAYIPAHPAIEWPCAPYYSVGWDTSDARYLIHHNGGDTIVSRNQAPVSNDWVSLGQFYFKAGTTGYVRLSDLTGEANYSKTVSFSAMRFTYLYGPQQSAHFVPAIFNRARSALDLQAAWTEAIAGDPRSAFLPSESLRLRASGENTTHQAISAQIKWVLDGPCGKITLHNSSVNLAVGDWSHTQTVSAPACLGVHTLTFTLTAGALIQERSAALVIHRPFTAIASSLPAFDKCTVPSLSQMATWWNSSPYYTINLYIGGIHRACQNLDLTPAWVYEARRQGWSFIPTWVGPQAPCTTFYHRMSFDPQQAGIQGRAEADAALTAANALGLQGAPIIYYDLEAFPGASASCRSAVSAFMNGWSQRLHELDASAGIYGSPCSSYLSDFAGLTVPPDNVWIAHWVDTFYNPQIGVWNVACLANSYWTDHQRLRQYTGGHAESWGGVALTIDSNAADGEVAAQGLFGEAVGAGEFRSARLQDFQPLSPSSGWVIQEGNLLWTRDGGATWEQLATDGETESATLAAFFLDDARGWVVTRSPDQAALQLRLTTDGGRSWEQANLPDPLPDEASEVLGEPGEVTSIQFVSPQVGWVTVKLTGSSNFSRALLYQTGDGGQSWQVSVLPSAGRVHFTDSQHGSLWGGAEGTDFYLSQDGGQNWRYMAPVERGESVGEDAQKPGGIDAAGRWLFADVQDASISWMERQGLKARSAPAIAQPGAVGWIVFADDAFGWAIVQGGECTGEKLPAGAEQANAQSPFSCRLSVKLLSTLDGGASWTEITPP